MKKIGLAILGVIAAIIVLVNLGSLLGLALSALITYAGFHYFRKTDSSFKKFFWGGVMLVGLLTAVSNVPAFFGILALVGILFVWSKWNEGNKNNDITDTKNPFVNFEREWQNFTK